MTATPEMFEHAFDDLVSRLTSGLGHLGVIRDAARPDDAARLISKWTGLKMCLDKATSLKESMGAGAPAWRTYTTDMSEVLHSDVNAHAGFFEGIALGLSYQRGYGADIDAPRFVNPRVLDDK